MEEEPLSGPWRATRLWNDIIRTLRAGLPVRRVKRGLRTHEAAIPAAELVAWLHKALQGNVNFGADVTREQTVQLLRKLHRAGVLESVRGEEGAEFRETGEVYRLSHRSPVKTVRSPQGPERRVLGDLGNTPRKEEVREEAREVKEVRRRRDRSAGRKAREEEARRDLNLSYFQSLPSNSLIVLDNDGLWRSVYCSQLAAALSPHHLQAMEAGGLIDMGRVVHNMTRVSPKGIVQVEDRAEDLPHWVLSAMKCLANWPRQLRTTQGRESCLPSYPGFENDVFNVVKDYFLGLAEPLTTAALFHYYLDSWVKAEALAAAAGGGHGGVPPGCHQPGPPAAARPGPANPPTSSTPFDPYTSINPPCSAQFNPFTTSYIPVTSTNLLPTSTPSHQFYTMEEGEVEGEHLHLSHQERVARVRSTFSVLPPLATSSLRGSTSASSNPNSTSSTLHSSTFHSSTLHSSTSLSLELPRTCLPPNTCFETVFMECSPVTRIVPQASSEVLHLSRSSSHHSLSHIATSLPTRSSSTQTEGKSESLRRLPRWRRSSRLRKSVAVMDRGEEGLDNRGFATSPREEGRGEDEVRSECGGMRRGPHSAAELGSAGGPAPLRPAASLDQLVDGEAARRRFLAKYRQVSGDLRVPAAAAPAGGSGKAVRKEKRKARTREGSVEGLTPALRRLRVEEEERGCYDNPGVVASPRAPLAPQEAELSPVGLLPRGHGYNSSYRLATLQPGGTPRLPRTSTKLSLPRPAPPPKPLEPPYTPPPPVEPVYTVAGPGPLRRYPAPLHPIPRQEHALQQEHALHRGAAGRASCWSQATADSGRGSLAPGTPCAPAAPALPALQLLGLLLPPASRRKLQLLLKFILKIAANPELRLDPTQSNASLCLGTFLPVVLRPAGAALPHADLARPVLQCFLQHYAEVWAPPEALRREVEEQVYRSLVRKRLKAGEDPYPVTYCRQVTREQYQEQQRGGSMSALEELLEAILADPGLQDKQKRKKLAKFKEAYPDMWRRRFPTPSSEPPLTPKPKPAALSLSRLRSVIRM